MELFSLAIAGFSIVVAALLWLTYLAFLKIPGKSAYSILSCTVLLGALVALQLGHLLHFAGGPEPLATIGYRIALFVAPPSFFLFGRWALLPDEPFRPTMLLALLPIALLLIPRLDVSLPMLFAIGAGFALWLGRLVYGLRAQRKQFRFELFWFGVMSVLAVGGLLLGFALPYIDHAWFYRFYCSAIGAAFAILVVALIAHPDLISVIADEDGACSVHMLTRYELQPRWLRPLRPFIEFTISAMHRIVMRDMQERLEARDVNRLCASGPSA